MTRRTIVSLLTALLVVSAQPRARSQSGADADLAARVDEIFAAWDTPGTPGCAVAVMTGGRVVHARGYGMANLDHDVPITSASVFHVASVSKQFTAAAIVLLAQEGRLSLDDEVREYVPELPDFGQRITIRHLVHHTSGLRDQWDLLGLAGWRYSLDLITDQDVLDVLSRQQDLNFTPGARHLYCNTGYTLLATIVARVSGQSFREFTRARIFEPLDMTSTHFRDDHAEVVRNQAYGYVPVDDGGFRLSVTNFDTVGATSLLTTVEDLAKWDRNFEDPHVGGRTLLAQMVERGTLSSGETLDYAFGLVHGTYRGLRTVSHGGSDAGYRSHYIRFPDQGFSVACLCNVSTSGPGDLVRKVADVYLADQLAPEPSRSAEPEPTQVPADQLARFAGVYYRQDDESYRKMTVKDGALHAEDYSRSEALVATSPTRFRFKEGAARLEFAESAPGRWELLERQGSGPAVVYQPVGTFEPTAAQLNDYAGTYVSDEIEPIYRMAVEEGALVLRRLKADPETLQPLTTDVFRGRRGTIRFVRDQGGGVSGFEYNGGRVKHLRFRRTGPGSLVRRPGAPVA